SVRVTDYFGDKPREIDVPLDAKLSLRENIDLMFKRYQKAVRGRSIVAKQIADIQNRRAALEEQTKRLQSIKDWDTWLAITSTIPARTNTVFTATDLLPRAKRFRTIQIDGKEVLIGKGARENDALTFEVAAPEDFWFHVADYSGSHVLVRNPAR